MKKFIITIVAATFACAAFAQTSEQLKKGSILIHASSTSMDFKFTNGTTFGINAAGGYFIMDKLAVIGGIGTQVMDGGTMFTIGAGARYYFLPLGEGALFGSGKFNLSTGGGQTIFGIGLEGGYAFFLNRYISIEPLLYLNIPFKEGAKVDVGIGAGISLYL